MSGEKKNVATDRRLSGINRAPPPLIIAHLPLWVLFISEVCGGNGGRETSSRDLECFSSSWPAKLGGAAFLVHVMESLSSPSISLCLHQNFSSPSVG